MGDVRTIDGSPLEDMLHDDFAEAIAPHEGVVEACRELLRRAEAGEINGIVAAYQFSDGTSGSLWSGRRTYAVLGRMVEAQHMIVREFSE